LTSSRPLEKFAMEKLTKYKNLGAIIFLKNEFELVNNRISIGHAQKGTGQAGNDSQRLCQPPQVKLGGLISACHPATGSKTESSLSHCSLRGLWAASR
jgi:hypothetical protein